GHQVLPRGISAARPRRDVIERQILRREDAPTVLTGVVVAQEDVLARQALSFEWYVDVFDQANHRRHRHGESRRVKPVIGTLFGVGNSLQNQHDGTSSRANVDRLERSVQNQNASVHLKAKYNLASLDL